MLFRSRFAQELPALRAQFLSFPTGRVDGPNALAYALRMRPGEIVYDTFTSAHVTVELSARRRGAVYLCLNATRSLTTAVLVQYVEGTLLVLSDYVREADPGSCLHDLLRMAQLDLRCRAPSQDIRLCAGPEHFADHDIVGLRGAAARVPAQLQRAGPAHVGRAEIRELLARADSRGPRFQVSDTARWTLNGLCGGFSFEVAATGAVAGAPRPGLYATLIGGLESFAALLKVGDLADDSKPNVQYTSTGQKFISALPGRSMGASPNPKGDWLRRE